MRIALWFLLASIPLSASSIIVSAWCMTAPTTQGPGSASCGDSFDTATATVNGFDVAAGASAAPGWYASNAAASFSQDLVITFLGGTGVGFAQPWLTLSISEHFGSAGSATASLGGCQVYQPGEYCSWNSVQFLFGVPEILTLSLNAGAGTFGELYESAAANGEAFYDGFLGFYDVYGNPLSGVTYEIGSVGQSSPESGTLLLTAMAGAALLARSRRRSFLNFSQSKGTESQPFGRNGHAFGKHKSRRHG